MIGSTWFLLSIRFGRRLECAAEEELFALHPLRAGVAFVAVGFGDSLSGGYVVQAQAGWAVGALGGHGDRLSAVTESPAYGCLPFGDDYGCAFAVAVEHDGS